MPFILHQTHDLMINLYCLCPEDTERGSMVEDFVAVVKGGSSESITALVSKKLPTPQLMNLWGEGVHFNPDFIRITVSFLYLLLSLIFCFPFFPIFVCVTSYSPTQYTPLSVCLSPMTLIHLVMPLFVFPLYFSISLADNLLLALV